MRYPLTVNKNAEFFLERVCEAFVSNQRARDNYLIALWLEADFLRALDEARAREHSDRSTFVRRAIAADASSLDAPA